MSWRKFSLTILGAFFVSSATTLITCADDAKPPASGKDRQEQAERDSTESTHDKKISNLIASLRHARQFMSNEPSFFIGGFSVYGEWKRVLPLSKQQEIILTKFDKLTRESGYYSMELDADYLGSKPADYQSYIKRRQESRKTAQDLAERLTAAGLLTKSQSAFVTKHYMLAHLACHSMTIPRMQEFLGLTDEQQQAMAKIWEKNANSLEHRKLMTEQQNKIWLELLEAPNVKKESVEKLTELSNSDREKINLSDRSPTFRYVSQNLDNLKLTDKQREFLATFREVVEHGLAWSQLDDESNVPKPIVKEHDEFMKYAERFLLTGILTETQSNHVTVMLMK